MLIASDVSGSMDSSISRRSVVRLKDIALFYGLIARKYLKNAHFGIFADHWKVLDDILSEENDIFKAYKKADSIDVGYSTNGHFALKWLDDNNVEVDRIMFFTDCILWNSSGVDDSVSKTFYEYKKNHPKTKLFFFDLAGYGQTPLDVREKGVYFVSGFSDRIFDAITYFEKGSNIVRMIKNYKI